MAKPKVEVLDTKNILNAKKPEAATTARNPSPDTEARADERLLLPDEILAAWDRYMDEHADGFLKGITGKRPTARGKSLVVTVGNEFEAKAVAKSKPRILQNLHQILNSDKVDIIIEIKEREENLPTEAKPLTHREIMQEMMEQYPKLAEFADEFGLRL